MSQPRRPKTEEEVEAEVQFYGLTNESAAAIVRLGNTLKGVKKLEKEHTELLTPGRRLHPPSPLSQLVWNQADIEDSPQPDLEAGICGLNLEAAADPIESLDSSSLDDDSLHNKSQTALICAVPGVDNIPPSQEPPFPSKFLRRALSPIQEEEEEEEEEGREDEDGDEDEDDEDGENAGPSENSSGR
ncbi:hypothetical protein GGI43DRAFT_384920 [Trichoderma evansii]